MNPGYYFADTNSIPWRRSAMAEGVEVKDLGTVNGQSMQLVRFAAGNKFPAHVHQGALSSCTCSPARLFRMANILVQVGLRRPKPEPRMMSSTVPLVVLS